MPHTSHRKAKHSQRQSRQVTSSDGWTTITHKSHTPINPATVTSTPDQQAKSQHTLADLQEDYARHYQRWSTSPCRQQLDHLLQDLLLSSTKKIDRCLCLGLGSVAGSGSSTTSMYQLAALETTLDILLPNSLNDNNKIVAQDPVFEELDRLLLQSKGISIVESPAGFNEIVAETLVYAPHCETEVVAEHVLGGQWPGIIVCNDLQRYVDINGRVEGRVEGFLRSSTGQRFPVFESDGRVFNDLCVYAVHRKDAGEDEAKER